MQTPNRKASCVFLTSPAFTLYSDNEKGLYWFDTREVSDMESV